MDKTAHRTARRLRRKRGLRKKLSGTPERPRLTVYRSNKQIYAQVIDDVSGKTLAAASSTSLESGSSVDAAKSVGSNLADAAKKAGVEAVAFDRAGYHYHGRVKALADAAREGGLKF